MKGLEINPPDARLIYAAVKLVNQLKGTHNTDKGRRQCLTGRLS